MSDQNIDGKQQGKLVSTWGAITRLLSDNPLLALVALIILVPLSAEVSKKVVIEQNIESSIPIIVLMCLIVCLVCIPLVIINTWKKNQNSIAEDRSEAIKSEAAKISVIENSKQERFHELMNQKIAVLNAQQDYILSQSDRHERHVLHETSKNLSDSINKSFTFVEEKTCSNNVNQILKSLAKHEIKFDEVLVNIQSLQQVLNVQSDKATEEKPFINIQDQVDDPDETKKEESWEKIAEFRQTIIEDHLKEIDILKEQNENQAKLLIVLDKKHEILPTPQRRIALPTLYQDELDKEKEKSKINLDMPGAPEQEHMRQIKKRESEILNYWTCPKCQTTNPLKRSRCKNCTKSKPISVH